MKYIISITLLFITSQLRANDSTARVHLKKTKDNILASTILTGAGLYCVYSGILQQDNTVSGLGVVCLVGGAATATVATWHYAAAQVEIKAGIKSVGIRIRF